MKLCHHLLDPVEANRRLRAKQLVLLRTQVEFHFVLSKPIVKLYSLSLGESEAGFTQEWASSADERVERRQTEVQANTTGNPTPEYRTVVAATPNTPQVFEEERE